MRVPARIYASEKLLAEMDSMVFEQTANVATLPGIVGYSLCMPDGHWGYGFPIGGVAAMDPATGVISPGGIGFDINCGMRLLRSNLDHDEIKAKLPELVDRLFGSVPSGVGAKGRIRLSVSDLQEICRKGARWCIEKGYGWDEDLSTTEEGGCIAGATPENVSDRAMERGQHQLGTLGSGNHYLEIQVSRPENVFDADRAKAFGLTRPNQVVVMFHCGSRGFGHQIATDYIAVFLRAMVSEFHITVPERELACAPFGSRIGQEYFGAMKCAVNMAFANRQLILHHVREAFTDVFRKDPKELGLHQIYDVAHNIAKIETHIFDGTRRELLVHRKGSTRAFGPGCKELPAQYLRTGQPVIIGGSMETGSYLLAGVEDGKQSFYSTAHGSGRIMSRKKARHLYRGTELQKRMFEHGIYVRTASFAGLAEEAGEAYKNIDEVITAASAAGLAKPVVRLTPIGNVKG